MTAPEVNAIKELTKAIREFTRELKPKGDMVRIYADNQEYVQFGPDDILDQEIVKTVKNVLLDHDLARDKGQVSLWDADEMVRKLTEAGVAFTRITP